MQLSYDSRGNSVPTILLLMQQRLYEEGGLQVQLYILFGDFLFVGKITNSQLQEGYVKDDGFV